MPEANKLIPFSKQKWPGLLLLFTILVNSYLIWLNLPRTGNPLTLQHGLVFFAGLLSVGVLCFIYYRVGQLRKAMAEQVRDQSQLEASGLAMKQHQYPLQSVLDNTPAIIFIKDLQGKYTVANQRFMDLLQISRDQVIGFTDFDISSDEQAAYFAELDAKVIAERRPVEVEQIIQGPEGPLHLSLMKFPLFDEDNQVFAVSGIATDITERIEHREALILARQSAEHAKLLQEQFLANMSHEIRTPMNGIQGMANLLLETEMDSRQKEYATIIKRSVNNLLVIINDILDFSKIQAGKLTIESIGFSLKEVLGAIEPIFSHRLKKKQLTMEWSIAEDVPDYISGDPYRLNQILINLVGNAIKFTENGKIRVSVQMQGNTGSEIRLKFSVVDSGIGIAPEKLLHIFDSFSQAESDIARKYGGTGLGLTISRQLVELQQGQISVRSELGVGSEFMFEIPFGVAGDHEITERQRIQDIDFSSALAGKRLMVAEDNYVNQILIEHVLKSIGIQVYLVNNGKEAIAALQHDANFDLILMDLQMPLMDGYETTDFIRNELKLKIPVIAMTATAMKGEMEKCLESGMTDYISKPFEFNDLYRKLSEHIGNRDIPLKTQSNSGIIAPVRPPADTSKPYDLSLFAKFSNKNDLIGILLPIQSSLIQEIGLLTELIVSGDWTAVAKLAHKLRSSVGYLKANELLEMLIRIEAAAKDVTLNDQLQEMIIPMKRIADNIVDHLATEINSLKEEMALAS